MAAASDAFASAFSTARGGFVRDTLVAGYPRLVGLLEGVVARVLRDSAARDVGPALEDDQVGQWWWCDGWVGRWGVVGIRWLAGRQAV